MATRRERVVLELEDQLSGGLAKDAAAVALLKRELNDLDKTSTRAGRSLSTDATRGVSSVGSAAEASGKDIDRFSGRLRLMADIAAVLGPGLIPIGAVGIPAVAGLANMMAFSAAGAGTLALAMVGVGDTLKAVREAELEPSAANLAEMQQKMSDLSPAARQFVLQLDDMMPRLTRLRDAAQQGAMPGLSRALEEFDQQIPETSRLIYELADAVGDLAAEGVESLGSERWAAFFDFMQGEARPAMQATAHVTGDLVHALAELWMAFDPANDDFAAWLEGQAAAIDDWATGLDQTEGFQDFLDYIRETGPQVADTLGAVGNAAVQVLEAAAPLGGPVLQGLEIVFDGLAKLADSPIGPSLFGAAAALTVLNRTLQATGGILTGMGFAGAGARTAAASGGMFGMIGTGARTAANDFRSMLTPMSAAERASRQAGDSFNRQASAAASVGRQVGAAGLAVGALAVLSTDAGRGIGLTNTAMLGLTGSIAGPWGAAAGTVVGGFLDFQQAAHRAGDAVDSFNRQIANVSSVTEYQQALTTLNGEVDALADSKVGKAGIGFDAASKVLGGTDSLGGTVVGGMADAFGVDDSLKLLETNQQAKEDFASLQEAARGLADAQGMAALSTADLDRALQGASPAMSALGISAEDLIAAEQSGGLDQMVGKIEAWQRHADSAAGRTDAFAKSVEDLGNDALSTADSATQMSTALEALLSPTLTAEQATDAWRQSLQTLQKELKDGAGFKGFSKGALENRQITRDYVTDSMARLTALAGLSTTSEKDMANAVAATRREFIASGIAAGFSRKEMVARANALKLTPKLVKTVFEAAGIDEVDLKARRIRDSFQKLPKRVQTDLRANGIPETEADVDRLVSKYKLTEKQRRALITIKDLASKDVQAILLKLGLVDKKVAVPSIVLSGAGAVEGALNSISGWLSSLDGRTATTWVTTRHVNVGGMGPQAADGVTVPKTGRGYADRHPYLLADGEEVISNRHGQADRHRQLLKAISANRYADGGTVNGWAGRHPAGAMTHRTERVVERVVERLPRSLVLDAGDMGRVVIDTVDARIDAADLMTAQAGRAR